MTFVGRVIARCGQCSGEISVDVIPGVNFALECGTCGGDALTFATATTSAPRELTLREKQSLFAILKAQLVLWIRSRGWSYVEGEGYVGDTDAADGDHDGPHKAGGAHYTKTGEDGALFVGGRWDGDVYVGGRWISAGGTPEWKAIGERWEKMHPLCRWGGRFRDDNHLSVAHGGRA